MLTASQPFTTAMIASNYNLYRYNWVWEKDNCSNFMQLKKQAGKKHEDVCVFYKKQPVYNSQMIEGKESHSTGNNIGKIQDKREYLGIDNFEIREVEKTNLKYATSIIKFNACGRGLAIHPTQKPVALFEYLIKTYTNEGDLVLDNCSGSGTTAIAAINTNRKWICIEKEKEYIDKTINRIEKGGE